MKTKIIYISGNEIFDMADIRAAFDEVRTALSLGPDTVLFGVPVDKEDALAAPKETESVVAAVAEKVVEPIIEPVMEEKAEGKIDIVPEEIEKPKTKRTRTRAKVIPISDTEPEKKKKKTSTVIPILSVLGSNATDEKSDEQNTKDTIIDDIKIEMTQPIADTTEEIEEPVAEVNQVTITDTIEKDAKQEKPEKTLEELLESMTPLGEDADKKPEPISDVNIEETNVVIEEKTSDDDTDATLERLANEFVENQDKITTPSKPASRSKIGKLKNILPFKKAKHDDSGLMGDLFGWAGVAANDEDFTIPGFFTNAVGKK